MKRIFILWVAVSCALGMNAQSKKEMEKAVESSKKKKTEMEARYQALRSLNARIATREFSTETPEDYLRRRLVSYPDVKSMAKDNIFKKEPKYKDLPIAKGYISLIEMYKSLGVNGGYSKEQNEEFKKELDAIKEQVENMNHKDSFLQSFDDLAKGIRDYRFAMFELPRVFALVKEMEKKGRSDIYLSLQKDAETDIIDQIPYTQKVLKNYIEYGANNKGDLTGGGNRRSELIKKLRSSCAEAFENFKE